SPHQSVPQGGVPTYQTASERSQPTEEGNIVRRDSASILAQRNTRVKVYVSAVGAPDCLALYLVVRISRLSSKLMIDLFLGAEPRFNGLSICFVIKLCDNPAFYAVPRTDEDGQISPLLAPRSGMAMEEAL
ncbi:hypothetical protein E4U09_007961, partial [Claviceps aff. purpurea]